MVKQAIKLEAEGVDGLAQRIARAGRVLKDLRPMFELFASDFYKEEKRIFQASGPGRYVDLSPRYKAYKQRNWGFVYPILFRDGELADSLLRRDAPGSHLVIGEQEFEIGTTVDHAKHHHEGRGRLPPRPIFDEDPEGPMIRRWFRIADAFLGKAVQGAFDGKA